MVTYFPDFGNTYVYLRISVTVTGLIIKGYCYSDRPTLYWDQLKYTFGINVTVTLTYQLYTGTIYTFGPVTLYWDHLSTLFE